MKIMIASDIHGDAVCTRKLLEEYKRIEAEKLVLLGDILYHGPRNDLPTSYAPKRVIELLNPMKSKIIAVRGNCDAEVDQMVLQFPIMADYARIEADGLSIFVTHGHHHNTTTPPPLEKGEIMLHGHTHILKIEEFGDGNFYINPGSVALPKEGNPRSYAVYENRTFTIKELDGKVIIQKQF